MGNDFATGSLAGVFKIPYRLVLGLLFKCRRGWSESAGPRAQVGELVGDEESGLSRSQLTN
jgi:hypothetical protein